MVKREGKSKTLREGGWTKSSKTLVSGINKEKDGQFVSAVIQGSGASSIE